MELHCIYPLEPLRIFATPIVAMYLSSSHTGRVLSTVCQTFHFSVASEITTTDDITLPAIWVMQLSLYRCVYKGTSSAVTGITLNGQRSPQSSSSLKLCNTTNRPGLVPKIGLLLDISMNIPAPKTTQCMINNFGIFCRYQLILLVDLIIGPWQYVLKIKKIKLN